MNDILITLLDVRWITGMVVLFFLIVLIWAYWSAMKEERLIKQVKDKQFKYFKETKSFENGFYVLKIKFELQEDSELHNKVIIRHYHDYRAVYKKMHLLEKEGEGNRWVDSRGFQADESYFENRQFVLDTRKNEIIFKDRYEGSIDDFWVRLAKDVRFWKCIDTPFELKESA